jgi:4-carboxymuconolactone decarboxylase
MKDEGKHERGLRTMGAVYGQELVDRVREDTSQTPYMDDTIEHLFAEVWARPGLSVRDRRLLVIGVTAALGRADLIEAQVAGALDNGELTPAELEEILLQLAYYVGWPNSTAVARGMRAAQKKTGRLAPRS